MLTYIEDEDNWKFQVDAKNKIVPGEFQFITFAGYPSVRYISGGFDGCRSIDSKEQARNKLLPLGFVEVDREPQKSTKQAEEMQLSDKQLAWIAAQLNEGADYMKIGSQYLFFIDTDKFNLLMSDLPDNL